MQCSPIPDELRLYSKYIDFKKVIIWLTVITFTLHPSCPTQNEPKTVPWHKAELALVEWMTAIYNMFRIKNQMYSAELI